MEIVPADGPLLDTILDDAFPIWNEGLAPDAYRRWNAAQLRTAWGRDHLQRLALVAADGTLLASAKRYRFDIRLDDREGWMCGIGALLTPPPLRGRGHARRLVELLLQQERQAGALCAALFSEIGAAFYERLGFACVPLDEVTVRVKRKGGVPAMLVRAGEERDLPAVAAMHDVRSSGVRFSLQRRPALIAFALARKRLLAGFGPPGLRQLEFFVAEEGATAVAYLVLSVNANGWTLEEAGDRDPAGARLGAILQVLLGREPARPTPLIRAWWPRAFPVPPQLELAERIDSSDILMMRPLADVALPSRADDVFYWRSDYF